MWLAALLGVGVGVALQAAADRLPPSSASRWSPRIRYQRGAALLVLCAGILAYLQRYRGWGVRLGVEATYCCLLLLVAAVDLEHRIVPNALVGGGIVLALIFNLFYPAPGLAPALSGAAVGGGVFLLLSLLRRNAMGMGDVKLAALIGMMTGFPLVLQALAFGIVLGGLAAAALIATGQRKPREYMAYAPYLVAGCVFSLLWGQRLAGWCASAAGLGG